MFRRASFMLLVFLWACTPCAGLAISAEQAKLTDEQRQALAEKAKRLWVNAQQLDHAGKLKEAVSAGEELLKVERQLLGNDNPGVAFDLDWLAERYVRLENFRSAQEARQEALQNKSARLGADHWQVTDARWALARVTALSSLTAQQRAKLHEADALLAKVAALHAQGTYALAIPLAETALAERKAILGEEQVDVAEALHWLARECKFAGDYARSTALFKQAVAARQRKLGEKHPEYARSLHELAELDNWIGDHARSEREFQEAAEIRKAVLGTAHPDYAASLNGLACLYEAMGAYPRAQPLFEQALAIRKQAFGEKHPEYGETLNSMAELYQSMGDNARAEELYRQALEIRKVALGEAHPDYAISLNNLAELHRAMGDYTKAEPLYRDALAIKKQALGENHPSYLATLNNLASLYQSKGDYARAEPLYRQTLEIKKRVLGEAHPEYATSLNNLAVLYQAMGDYSRAEPLSREAAAIWKKSLGPTHPYYALALNNLAFLYRAMEKYALAEPLYLEALSIKEAVLGKKHPDYATTLSNLAFLYQSMGDYAKAEPLYLEALEIRTSAQGKTHPDYASSLSKLASLYAARRDFAKAEPLYEQALEIRRRVLGETHPDYAQSLNDRAALFQAMGKFDQAEPLYREALSISGKNLELAAMVQSERQQIAMAGKLRFYFDSYLSLALAAGRFEASAYEAWLAWKGMVAARQKIARAATDDPALAGQFAELQTVAQELARRAFATPAAGEEAAWQQKVVELSERLERIQATLIAGCQAYREAVRQVTVPELQAALDNSVLIDFVEYGRWQTDEKATGGRLWEQRLAAFVVPRRGAIELVDLGLAEPIAIAADAWRESFGRSEKSQDAARLLRQKIWTPLEDKLVRSGIPNLQGPAPAPQLVLISPDGSLNRIPLSALPGKKPGSYLLEDWPIAIVPAPQGLLEGPLQNVGRLAATAQAKAAAEATPIRPGAAATANLLVFGGVDYDAREVPSTDTSLRLAAHFGRQRGTESETELRFDPLPGTRGELATIKELYSKKWTQTELTTLAGTAATEEAFRKEAPRHLYLHVATHGFFAPESVKSFLGRQARNAAAGSERLASGQSLAGYHPNLLSGLAFAGANHPKPDGDDGILTAEEVAALDLRRVELVVLSACETGLGERAGGEGLLGLQRAFQIAGAKTVIASLWKVDDVATRDLMERFYDNLWNRLRPDGKPYGTLEALREAQLWMLTERGPRGLKEVEQDRQRTEDSRRLPPYYWAAFVLSGDWR